METKFPYKYDELFNATLQALHNLGGSSSISEMQDEVADILQLTEEEVNAPHKGNRTKLSYRLAWSRNYLKRYGALENSTRGVWALTEKGKGLKEVDKAEVNKYVKSIDKSNGSATNVKDEESEAVGVLEWEEQLLEVIKNIQPDQFERLCQRLLRELGFIDVEVTGRSGDGGIDGKGILRLGGVLSFHVAFQAKRYQGSVSSSTIRDFRGAIMGRADKGLVITTGSFTRDAKAEAQRDGATPIDLIDGNDLVEKLKDVRLGVEVEMVEDVSVNSDWYNNL